MTMKQLCQVFASAFVLLTAILVGIMIGGQPSTIDLEREPALAIRRLTSVEMSDYQRDGSVLAKALLTREQVETVKNAIVQARDPYAFFRFLTKPSFYDLILFDVWRSTATIAVLALKSLPIVAADIMFPSSEQQQEQEQQPFRLLRDAYFRYAPGGSGCGWHVDDGAFWPTHNDTSGVTIWIALDDMTHGGGLLMANRTMVSDETVQQCRAAIDGHTCDMETLAPDCYATMERAKIQWQVQPGDAILWDRWTYHRTDPIVAAKVVIGPDGRAAGSSSTKSTLSRYSIRYVPATATALGLLHWSVPPNGTFVGSPYYPQVWPTLLAAETKALARGLEGDISVFLLMRLIAKTAYASMMKYIGVNQKK
jgi:Phytanoyl-CoA dioxygenase (PhyH)